jgi:hypothetical protein
VPFRCRELRLLVPARLRPVGRDLQSKSQRLRARLFPKSRKRIFKKIYERNGFHRWSHGPSLSGPGSDLEQTAIIAAELPGLLADLGVRSILDAPCGDFFWMRRCPIDVDIYVGMDIVPALVDKNTQEFGSQIRQFATGDLVTDVLPRVDAIFCRDCIVHLPFRDGLKMIENFKRSCSTYLLTTTYTERSVNEEIDWKGWRPLNLQLAPFGFPPPLRVINEGCTEWGGTHSDKSIAVWRLEDLV